MINKIFNFFFGGTKVSFLSKKTMIIDFKKDLKKQTRVINLKEYQNFTLMIEKETEGSEFINNYKLVLNDEKKVLVLAYFETLKDAENAKLDLLNKIQDRFLTVLYTSLKLVFLFFIFIFLMELKMVTQTKALTSRNVDTGAVMEQMRNNQSQNIINEETLKKLKELQAQTQGNSNVMGNDGQMIQNNPAPSQQVNISPGSNDANNILGAL